MDHQHWLKHLKQEAVNYDGIRHSPPCVMRRTHRQQRPGEPEGVRVQYCAAKKATGRGNAKWHARAMWSGAKAEVWNQEEPPWPPPDQTSVKKRLA